jgi:hypothetical protein
VRGKHFLGGRYSPSSGSEIGFSVKIGLVHPYSTSPALLRYLFVYRQCFQNWPLSSECTVDCFYSPLRECKDCAGYKITLVFAHLPPSLPQCPCNYLSGFSCHSSSPHKQPRGQVQSTDCTGWECVSLCFEETMAFKHAKQSFLVRLETLRRDHSEEVLLDGTIILKQISRFRVGECGLV